MQEGILPTSVEERGATALAILIANPSSGSYAQYAAQLQDTLIYLRVRGWKAELQYTQGPGDATHLAREAVQAGAAVVVAVGGDGTINEVIQGLAGSETALGVLPTGTVNVWAREVGIPLAVDKAREILVDGRTKRVDLGKINERYFLLMVGIGVDGEITHAVENKSLKKLGVMGYLVMASWISMNYGGFRSFIQIGEKIIRSTDLQIVIGNTQLYGGALKYTWLAKCDDGLLDICIVRKRGRLERLLVLKDLLLRRQKRSELLRYETSAEIKIRTKQKVAIQVDGDAMGYTAIGYPATRIRVVPLALKVIIPKEGAMEIFQEQETVPVSETSSIS